MWLEPPQSVDPHATGRNPRVRGVTTGTSSARDGAHDSDSNYVQTRDPVQDTAPRAKEESAERGAAGDIVEAWQGDGSVQRTRLGQPLSTGKVLAKRREDLSSDLSAKQGGCDGDEGGGEEEEEEERRRRWRPLILASPSGTSYAEYGPDDVVIVEPPHRGDDHGNVCRISPLSDLGEVTTEFPRGSPALTPDEDLVQHGEPLLLHELVALALRVKKSDRQFRRELEALLGRSLREE